MIGADRLEIQRVALRVAAGLALGASALAGGCAAPNSYMGLNLNASDLPDELSDLVRWAQAGDKQAQLDLGIAFEEGCGVALDLGRARRLYALAATDSGGPVWVYVPPVVPGQAGRVMQVGGGLPRTGLQAARARLKALEERQKVYRSNSAAKSPPRGPITRAHPSKCLRSELPVVARLAFGAAQKNG